MNRQAGRQAGGRRRPDGLASLCLFASSGDLLPLPSFKTSQKDFRPSKKQPKKSSSPKKSFFAHGPVAIVLFMRRFESLYISLYYKRIVHPALDQ
eukprot:scaffold2742_cov167-Amphora_coffeaeformis.AAC.4